MLSEVAWPWQVPPPTAVSNDSGWRLTYAGDEQHGNIPMAEHLQGWDIRTVFICERSLSFDTDAIRDACNLPAETTGLKILVTATTGRGRSRELLWQQSLPSRGAYTANPVIRFGDAETGIQAQGALSEDLRLETQLVLSHYNGPAQPFTANEPGSRLWSDSVTVNLTDAGPRLPIISVDFKEHFPLLRADGADYYVSLENIDSLDAKVLENVAIYANSRRTAFIDRLLTNDDDVIYELYEALVIQLAIHTFETALDSGTEHDTASSGTVRGLLREIYELAFEGMDDDAIRMYYRGEPSKFFTRMQSTLRAVAGDSI